MPSHSTGVNGIMMSRIFLLVSNFQLDLKIESASESGLYQLLQSSSRHAWIPLV